MRCFGVTYFEDLLEVYIPLPNAPTFVFPADLSFSGGPRIMKHSKHLGFVQGVV